VNREYFRIATGGQSLRTRACLSVLLLGIFFSVGCGGNGSTAAKLRFVLASPDAPSVKTLVDGSSVAANMSSGSSTPYISVKPGPRHIQVVPVSSSAPTPILDQTFSFSTGASQTLLVTGPVASIKAVVLTDGGTTSTTGDGYLRVFNASSTAGPSDVYIVPAGNSIMSVTPVAASLPYDEDTDYQLTAAGNYVVFLTAPGTTKVNFSTGDIDLNAGANQTVVVLDSLAGGFTFLQLADQ
jgi:hypothetical protein